MITAVVGMDEVAPGLEMKTVEGKDEACWFEMIAVEGTDKEWFVLKAAVGMHGVVCGLAMKTEVEMEVVCWFKAWLLKGWTKQVGL